MYFNKNDGFNFVLDLGSMHTNSSTDSSELPSFLSLEQEVVKLVLKKSATGHNVMEPVDIS